MIIYLHSLRSYFGINLVLCLDRKVWKVGDLLILCRAGVHLSYTIIWSRSFVYTVLYTFLNRSSSSAALDTGLLGNERVFKNLGVTMVSWRNQILVEFGFCCQNVFAWMAFKDVMPSVILLWSAFSFHQVFAYIDRLHFSLYIETKVDINGFLLPTAGLQNQLMWSKVEARMAPVQSWEGPVPGDSGKEEVDSAHCLDIQAKM